MNNIVKIYTVPNCGICKMAKKKKQDKNIKFEEYNLEDYIEKFNVLSAPVLQIGENILTTPRDINNWINKQ